MDGGLIICGFGLFIMCVIFARENWIENGRRGRRDRKTKYTVEDYDG